VTTAKACWLLAHSWPELLIGESAEFTHYFPPHQWLYVGSTQTVNLLAEVSKGFLFTKKFLWPNICALCGYLYARDLIDSIENIQPDALLVKNDEGKTPLDLLAQSLEEKAISVRKKFKPSAF